MSQSFEFKAEIQQLLNILVHSLYTEREIFLRELISNASDALHRLQFEMLTTDTVTSPDAELAIHITADKDNGTLTIRDSGIGMARDELITNLGTIAQSGAQAFLKALKESEGDASNIIGQFGVGFYSLFMVADEVRVTSRSYQPDAAAACWISDGSDRFTVEDAEKADRGTEILIKLKEDATEFTDEWRLRQIIKRHSDFIPFPIYLGEPPEGQAPMPVNQQVAIWRQQPADVEEDAYAQFYQQIAMDFEAPLAHVHLSSEAPLDLHAIVYVPRKRERGLLGAREPGLRLYSRKVLIKERSTDLVPEYLRFLEGVVDSEDLPLNVSREMVQASAVMTKIRSNIVRRVTGELDRIAQNEPERYAQFWQEFGYFIKEGVATTPDDHSRLLKLLRFHASVTGGGEWVSLQEYVDRMPEDQPHIYYLFGEDLHSITRSPHLDPFKASGTEVLFLTETVDSFMMSQLDMLKRDFAGHTFKNIADADIEAPQAEEAEQQGERIADDLFDPLLRRFNEVLADRVVLVRESKHLTGSPLRLVAPDDAPGDSMERVRKLVDQEFVASKRVVEVNRRHPMIQNMAQILAHNAMNSLVPQMIEQLFENALLIEGALPNPAEMVERIQAIMAAAASAQSAAES